MTRDGAEKLKVFDHHCTCGGYAYHLNGRNPADPHMRWCLQREQYNEWYRATHSDTEEQERWVDLCEHGKGMADYCEPCGRIHSN